MNRRAIILKNERMANSYYKMKFSCHDAINASPGQFIMVKVSQHYDPFLRRPMSFYKINKEEGTFEILYQVVGKGTKIMSELKEGDGVDILAPLGRGFWIPGKMEEAILIAGGIGVAPMVALSEELRITNYELRISVFIGGKTKNDILCKEDFERINADVHIATEDSSMGKKGTCVDSLSAFSRKPNAFIFACGPQGMLKAVADIARDKKIPCQVSLDKRMACGTGACLGCVVRTRQKTEFYKCVCTDGPVFDSEDINWEEI